MAAERMTPTDLYAAIEAKLNNIARIAAACRLPPAATETHTTKDGD